MKRLSMMLLLAFATPAFAQSTATPPAAAASGSALAAESAPVISDLSIPVPADAKVVLEIDATDDDMLGQVKELLSGIDAQQMVDAAVIGLIGKSVSGSTGVKLHIRPPALSPDVARINLADVLHNVKHVHLIVLEMPGGAGGPPAAIAQSQPSGLAPVNPGETSATPVVPKLDPKQIAVFYETTFHSAGGRRVASLNYDPVHFLLEGFPAQGGTAMVIDMPGRLVVLRSDGNLDWKPVTTLFSASLHEVSDALIESME